MSSTHIVPITDRVVSAPPSSTSSASLTNSSSVLRRRRPSGQSLSWFAPTATRPPRGPARGAGGVSCDGVLHRGRSVWPAARYAGAVVLNTALVAPFVLPLLPVPRYLAYAKALGVTPSTPEKKEVGPLPQHYADMFGWPEMAETIAPVWRTLPEADRAQTAAYVPHAGGAAGAPRVDVGSGSGSRARMAGKGRGARRR